MWTWLTLKQTFPKFSWLYCSNECPVLPIIFRTLDLSCIFPTIMTYVIIFRLWCAIFFFNQYLQINFNSRAHIIFFSTVVLSSLIVTLCHGKNQGGVSSVWMKGCVVRDFIVLNYEGSMSLTEQVWLSQN